jgi:site-specific DNA-methyltransferase (adenine-specific)
VTSVQIFQGNLKDLSPEIVSRFDVAICDLPYSEHVHKSATSVDKGTWRNRDLEFSYLDRETRIAACNLLRGIKRWTLLYSDVENDWILRLAMQARGVGYVRTLPWVRWSMPQTTGDRPPQGFEVVLCFHPKTRKRWNGSGGLVSLNHTAMRGEGKHKTQKPLDQMLDLVSWFSEPGEWVIDFTAGAGTTGRACQLLGRNFLGLELSETWAAFGQERLRSPLSELEREHVERYLTAKAQATDEDLSRPNVKRRYDARATDKECVRVQASARGH